MKTTLISAIGRGRKDRTDTVYQRCSYAIDGTTLPPSAFFVSAWLQGSQAAFVDRVHLIGTATSSWSALAEEYGETELWATLEEKCGTQNSPGVSEADIKPLAELLSRAWEREVRCHVLAKREIDDQNAGTITARLLELFPTDDPDRALQLDTTHALRTLPLLALSAVQCGDAFAPGLAARTTLLYGELLGESARGFAFHSVLQQQKLADATRCFFDTFDAAPLAEILENDAPRLAKALKALAATIQSNAFDDLSERLRQLKNASEECPHSLLRDRLFDLAKRLKKSSLPRQLVALAKVRAERRQYGNAILTLAEAATALSCSEPVTSFEAMKAAGREFAEALDPSRRKAWDRLFKTRNRIAHGANLLRQDGRLHHANLRKRYEEAEELLQSLL